MEDVSTMKNQTCRFCVKLAPSVDRTGPWDTVLAQSENFVVWPTIGSIVEGWLLVVPKQHYVCMGALPDELFAELDDLIGSLVPSLIGRYGAMTVFEHGPAQPNQPVGCGIDHAHLHVVPTECDLAAGAKRLLPELNWAAADCLRSAKEFHALDLPYLYLEQPLGKAYLATHPNLPSQLFRKVIAAHVGQPDRYDWRLFPEERNVSSTVGKLRPLFTKESAGSFSLFSTT